MNRAFLLLLILLSILSPTSARAVVAVASGNWSNPATWGGALPGGEYDVTIPEGFTVTLNADVECGGITVEGRL